jgi:transposase InsO family protein
LEVGSFLELGEISRRPHRSPNRTPESIEQRVASLRQATGWGGLKLSVLLAAEGISIHPSTVDRIVKRRGLVRSDKPKRSAPGRFVRERPNELWQMDFKGEYRLATGGCCYPLSILDDHSRFAIGLKALASQHGERVKHSLIGCFERYGVPEAMLVDHGTPWWSNTNGHGLTRLGIFLLKQNVRLLYSGYRHPQTQGKVERFHRTLDDAIEWQGRPKSFAGYGQAFQTFRQTYNQVRPHEALALDVPARHYRPSPRPYQANPSRWEYPPGSEVHTLNSQGSLDSPGERLFVCHALAGEEVLCQRFEQRMLVTYRHMQIREINLKTGRTTAVVRPVPQS